MRCHAIARVLPPVWRCSLRPYVLRALLRRLCTFPCYRQVAPHTTGASGAGRAWQQRLESCTPAVDGLPRVTADAFRAATTPAHIQNPSLLITLRSTRNATRAAASGDRELVASFVWRPRQGQTEAASGVKRHGETFESASAAEAARCPAIRRHAAAASLRPVGCGRCRPAITSGAPCCSPQDDRALLLGHSDKVS